MTGRYDSYFAAYLVKHSGIGDLMTRYYLNKVLFFFFAFFILASSAQATTYWASPSGGATSCGAASGTSDPGSYQTFAQGVACMSAGDTLMLKDGSYSTAWNIDGKNGNSEAYFTIRAASISSGITRNRGVILQATTLPMLQVQNSSYVEIRGVKFDASMMDVTEVPTDSGATIYLLSNDNHIRFVDNEIVDSQRAGITMSSSGSGFSEGTHEILSNWIHNIGLGTNPALTHAVYVKLSNVLVEGNRIEDVAGWAIHAYDDGLISSGNIFCCNFIKNAGTSSQGRGGGILDFDSAGTLIYDNIFVSIPTWAIVIEQSGADAIIYNNVLYNNDTAFYLGPTDAAMHFNFEDFE